MRQKLGSAFPLLGIVLAIATVGHIIYTSNQAGRIQKKQYIGKSRTDVVNDLGAPQFVYEPDVPISITGYRTPNFKAKHRVYIYSFGDHLLYVNFDAQDAVSETFVGGS